MQDKNLQLLSLSVIYAIYAFGLLSVNSQLTLYLINSFAWPEVKSYQLSATFNSLLFSLPVLAGYFVDQFNLRTCVILGLLLSSISIYLLSMNTSVTFYVNISMIVVGYTLITPAIICQINAIYKNTDNNKKYRAMTFFYLWINVGAFFGSLIGGYLSQLNSASFSFKFSASIIALSFLLYLFSTRRIPIADNIIKTRKWPLTGFILTVFLFFEIITAYFLLLYPLANTAFLMLLFACSLSYLFFIARKFRTTLPTRSIIAFGLLCLTGTIFWSLYMLEPSLISVFINNHVDRHFYNIKIPASSFYSLNSFFIILFGLLIAKFPLTQKLKRSNSFVPIHFTTAIFLIALAYLLLAYSHANSSGANLISIVWPVGYYALMALAELFVGPTGMSMAVNLAPIGNEARFFGVWQLSIAFSAMLSGHLASYSQTPKLLSQAKELHAYLNYFKTIGLFAFLAGVLLLFTVPLLIKLLWTSSLRKLTVSSKPT